MLETITSHYKTFLDLTQNNPVLAGIFALYGAGIFVYLFRTVPTKIKNFFTRQCTTSIMLRSVEDNSYMDLQIRWFMNFITWYSETKWFKVSRAVRLFYHEKTYQPTIVPGYGRHFFFYNWRLYWFQYSRVNDDKSASRHEREEIHLHTLGRSIKPIRDLFKIFLRVNEFKDKRYIYRPEGTSWKVASELKDRSLDRLVYTPGVLEDIKKWMSHYLENESWYRERFLDYKKTVIFEGPPGTGKTSLIKAVASHFRMSLAIVNLRSITDTMLVSLVENLPSNTILLFEDFDGCKSLLKSRNSDDQMVLNETILNAHMKGNADNLKQNEAEDFYGGVSLNGFLNVLEGVVELDNKVIFMSTNVLHEIEPVVYRPSRVDHILHIPRLGEQEVKKLTKIYFPNNTLTDTAKIPSLPGSFIKAMYVENFDNFEAYERALASYSTVGKKHEEELINRQQAIQLLTAPPAKGKKSRPSNSDTTSSDDPSEVAALEPELVEG